jgi:hypothetical protein
LHWQAVFHHQGVSNFIAVCETHMTNCSGGSSLFELGCRKRGRRGRLTPELSLFANYFAVHPLQIGLGRVRVGESVL